jgi:hypothetical protein
MDKQQDPTRIAEMAKEAYQTVGHKCTEDHCEVEAALVAEPEDG